MSIGRIGTGLVLALLADGAQAQGRDAKFKLLLDGLYGFELEYGETRSFQEFAETGSLDVNYASDAGPGFGVGLQWNPTPRFGLRASGTFVKRDGSASFVGRLPHPLYFNRPREVAGELTGLAYKESSGHLDLVFAAGSGKLDVSLFAGGSLIKVQADLAGRLEKTEAYPYDEIDASLRPTSVSDSPFGFNAGIGLDYLFSDRLAFGAQFFFSRATAELATSDGASLEVDAGGPHVSAGLRLMF